MCEVLGRRLSRRGAVLALLGIVFIVIGASTPTAAQPPRESALFHAVLPPWLRAAAWLGTGVVALVFAPIRRPGADRFGFTALVVMPVLNTASYFVAWILYLLPLEPGVIGTGRGWSAAAVWMAVTGLVIVCAGWPDPTPRLPAPPPRRELDP